MRTHDNTMLDAYAYCERLYGIHHVANKRSIHTRTPLSYGGLWHTGLDVYYSHLATDRNFIIAGEAAIQAVAEAVYEDPLDDFRTRARCIHDFMEYCVYWKNDPELEEIFFTETAFSLPADVINHYGYGGIIDLWPKYQGRHWILDHKTTTRFGNYYYDNFKRSPQMLGYLNAAEQLHGIQPAGVLINTIILHKGKTEFDRKPIIFPDFLMHEWKEMQEVNLNQITVKRGFTSKIDDIFDNTIWKPNLYNCVGKYGRCGAYEVCHSRPENRMRVLDSEYEDHQWDWSNRDDD